MKPLGKSPIHKKEQKNKQMECFVCPLCEEVCVGYGDERFEMKIERHVMLKHEFEYRLIQEENKGAKVDRGSIAVH